MGLEHRSQLEHNQALADKIADYVTIALWTVTIVGLLIDIACLKWIKIADALFYLELLHTVISCLVPF